MRPGHRALCFAVSLAGWCALAVTAVATEYHGMVLTRGTRKPVASVVVQAYNLGTPAGLTPRILATVKTDAQGQFLLSVTDLVRTKNVALIVTPQGATSKFNTMGAHPVVETSFDHVIATAMRPSPKDNIVMYANAPRSTSTPQPTPGPAFSIH